MTLKMKVIDSTAMNKGNDFEFQGHAIEIENFNYHH